MSEYQYYEFCKIDAPLTSDVRKEMYSLSSRANVTTHGASYVYNYGDFRGNPRELLLKYFDVFFYISNWGSIKLVFKYPANDIKEEILKKYCIKHMIDYEVKQNFGLLSIDSQNENGFGWIEGETMLADILPLYYEIKNGDYHFLHLMGDVKNQLEAESGNNADISVSALTEAQAAFFKYAGIDQKIAAE